MQQDYMTLVEEASNWCATDPSAAGEFCIKAGMEIKQLRIELVRQQNMLEQSLLREINLLVSSGVDVPDAIKLVANTQIKYH